MMNYLLRLLLQNWAKDLSNWMHVGSETSNEQQDMGMIYGLLLYGLSEAWILGNNKRKNKDFVTIFDATICPYDFFFWRQGLYSTAYVLCRSGWPWSPRYPPASVSGMLWLKVNTTMHGISIKFWMLNKINIYIIAFTRSLRNGLLVERTGSSSREEGFNSQHTSSSSQLSITPDLGIWHLHLASTGKNHTWSAQTYMQSNTYTHLKNLFTVIFAEFYFNINSVALF